MTPIIYSHLDASAPALTGQVGSGLALIDAILRTGYGSKDPLGWTREFTGTNVAVYRNNSITGTGLYCRIDDNGTGPGGAQELLVRGYESMSDVDTGTGPFPSTVQLPNAIMFKKSHTTSATARPWWAIGDDRTLYLFFDASSGGLGLASPYIIGDVDSNRPGDAYNFTIQGIDAYGVGTGSAVRTSAFSCIQMAAAVVTGGAFLARNAQQVPGGIRCSCKDWTNSNSQLGGLAMVTYPDPVSGGLLYQRSEVRENEAWRVRGFFRGMYIPLHDIPFADLTTLTDVPGQPPGTSFISKIYSLNSSGNQDGQVLFDITNEW